MIGPAAAVANAIEHDRDRDQREAATPRRARRARCAASSPSSSARSGRSSSSADGHQHASAASRARSSPRAGLADRADEPRHRLAGVVDVRLGDEVADDREHELRDADPDQDEAVAGDAVAPRQQVDQAAQLTSAPTSAASEMPALPTSNRMIEPTREQARARRDADEVRRGERVAEQPLEDDPGRCRGRGRRARPVRAVGSRSSRTTKSTDGSVREVERRRRPRPTDRRRSCRPSSSRRTGQRDDRARAADDDERAAAPSRRDATRRRGRRQTAAADARRVAASQLRERRGSGRGR